jgi:Ca2+-binding RTX toxin-like protein
MLHRLHHLARRPLGLAAATVLATAGIVVTGPEPSDAASATADGECAPYVGLPHVHVQRADHDGQTLTGGPGHDVLIANGFRNVTLLGAGGLDHLCGGPGDDTIRGGRGGDVLRGEGGNDRIAGGSGDDEVIGGAGNDRVSAGRGSDFVTVDDAGPAPDPDGVTDTVDGGTGENELSFGVTQAAGDVLAIDATAGAATTTDGMLVAFSGFSAYDGSNGPTRFVGSDASELFNAFSPHTEVHMGAGNDEVEAARGNVVDLGPGADTVDVLDNATVRGGRGRDAISIGFHRRLRTARHGVYAGGPGRDVLQVLSNRSEGGRPVVDAVTAAFDGGPGPDTVSLSGLTFPVTADLRGRRATWRASSLRWVAVERFRGSSRADDVHGSSKDDAIFGSGGNDVIRGRGGDDLLDGGRGHDVLWGGSGRDTCTTGEVLHGCEAH